MAGIDLRSPSFGDHQPIPSRHAKDHDNLSPALEWSGVPEETVELAVLCEDPDAPSGSFTHWMLAGLQPAATGLAEGEHPAAAVEGRNDFGEEATAALCRRSATARTATSSGSMPRRHRWADRDALGPGATPRPGRQGAGQRDPGRHLPALSPGQRFGSLPWRRATRRASS
jgi:hypothetical protein